MVPMPACDGTLGSRCLNLRQALNQHPALTTLNAELLSTATADTKSQSNLCTSVDNDYNPYVYSLSFLVLFTSIISNSEAVSASHLFSFILLSFLSRTPAKRTLGLLLYHQTLTHLFLHFVHVHSCTCVGLHGNAPGGCPEHSSIALLPYLLRHGLSFKPSAH